MTPVMQTIEMNVLARGFTSSTSASIAAIAVFA
jgi:hypothetical protein